MIAQTVIPDEITESNVNERQSWSPSDEDEENWEEFKENISQGISQPPIVRTTANGGYEVLIGQRRVEAAKEANVDQIEVLTVDWSDEEALRRSISENVDKFRKDVSEKDRAISLMKLAEMKYDGEGLPPYSWFADEIGVSKATVSYWTERLGDEWEDTVFDPTSQKGETFTSERLKNLGGRKLRSIATTTGGGKAGEWLGKQTVEHDLTIQDLAQIREHIQHGASLQNAVNIATGDLSIEDTQAEYENENEDTTPETTQTTDSPDSPTSPTSPSKSKTSTDGGTTTEKTSTAELSQPDSGSWTDQLDEQPPTPSITPTEDTDSDTSTETEERPPLVSDEAMERAQDIQGTADLQEEIEESSEEDGCLHFEFTVSGALAEASKKAIDEGFNNPEKLGEEALRNFLLGSPWMNGN